MIGKRNKYKEAAIWEVASYWAMSPDMQLDMLGALIQAHKRAIKNAPSSEIRSMLFEALSFINQERKRVEDTLKNKGTEAVQNSNFNKFIIYKVKSLFFTFIQVGLIVTLAYLINLAFIKYLNG